MKKLSLSLLLILFSLSVIFGGCGSFGSQSPAAPSIEGGASTTITIKWPEITANLIPAAANSIKVVISKGTTFTDSRILDRPAGGGTSTAYFNALPGGQLNITATAYPQTGAFGVPQATAATVVIAEVGKSFTVNLTMASTIDRVDVVSSATMVYCGCTIQLTATPKDRDGNIVLVGSSGINFSSSDTNSATANINGLLAGINPGNVIVTATETESGKSGTVNIQVEQAPILADTPWPKFKGNMRNSGQSQYVGAQTNHLKWTYTLGGQIWSSPVIGLDGTVYVGVDDSKLFAINSNGSLKWAYNSPSGNIDSSPAIGSDGTIYVGSYYGSLYAINPNGTLKWLFGAGGTLYPSPAIGSDGTIYVGGSWDNKIYAIKPDGALKWSYLTGDYIFSSPAIGSDGTIYIGSRDKKLYAMNPDGTVKWTFTTGDQVDCSSPSVGSDGTIYIGSLDKKLYAINSSGTLKWSYVTGGGIQSSPAIGSDGTIYVGSLDYKLYAINSNGTLKWSYTTGSYVVSSPIVGSDDTIYVGSEDRNLYALNSNGTLKWSYTTGDGIWSSPAIGSDGTIYVGSWDGNLYAFGN